MMPRIQPLDPTLVNQIAAGEVIERPGSVVKELLENAVDAGATQIDVEVEQGGSELIRIVDDGSGIWAEDLPLAFTSHATSKVSTVQDLESILTLGFRGEALASIGSVAQVQIQSRTAQSEQGAQIRCAGGQLGAVEVWNGRPGTRIEVRHLFYNIPARRKFLKTVPTEMGHISEAVIRLALGFPHLGIRLNHNERDVYSLTAQTPLEERITRFFGEEVGDKLVSVEAEQGPYRLTGFVAEPSINRGNARLQYFFVNGRCIRDRTLGHALQEALHGLLMVGRYAVGFLYLEMPPDQVDVNVHPSKSEVRFRDSQVLHHLVRSAVRASMQGRPMISALSTTRPFGANNPGSQGAGAWTLSRPTVTPARLFGEGLTGPSRERTALPDGGSGLVSPVVPAMAKPQVNGLEFNTQGLNTQGADAPRSDGMMGESYRTVVVDAVEVAAARIQHGMPSKALQFHDAYIVVEEEQGMLVIDQHALHERILYEQLKDRLRAGQLEVQRLLVPEPVDLPADQLDLAVAHQAPLAKLGLEIQPFGGNTLLVGSYPAMLSRAKPGAMLRSALEHLATAGHTPSVELLLDNLLRLMACHSAIKAGDKLTGPEMEALLAQRHGVADSHHCPHGRPTSLFFSKQDLDKQFERI